MTQICLDYDAKLTKDAETFEVICRESDLKNEVNLK